MPFVQDPRNLIADGGPVYNVQCPLFCDHFTCIEDEWFAEDLPTQGPFNEVFSPALWTGSNGATLVDSEPAGTLLGLVLFDPADICLRPTFDPDLHAVTWNSTVPTIRFDEPWHIEIEFGANNQGSVLVGETSGDQCTGSASMMLGKGAGGPTTPSFPTFGGLCGGGIGALLEGPNQPHQIQARAAVNCLSARLSVDPCGHKASFSLRMLEALVPGVVSLTYVDATTGGVIEADGVCYEITRDGTLLEDSLGNTLVNQGNPISQFLSTVMSWSANQRLFVSVSGDFDLARVKVGKGYVKSPVI